MRSTIKVALILILTACTADTLIHISADPLQGKPSSDNTLSYHYTIPSDAVLYRDLFNHIYFEGDTAGFSTAIGKQNQGGAITAHFLNADKTLRIPAERLEIDLNRAWGFSLVGSLLEHFHRDLLDRKLPANVQAIELPCRLEIAIPGKPARSTELRILCTFEKKKP